MNTSRADVIETADFINNNFTGKLCVGVITGTGLSDSLKGMEPVCQFNYGALPHFPASTADGHRGRLTIGRIDNKNVLIMQGRFHLYEGYTAFQVSYPVRVMQELGISTLIVNNAAGGINPAYNEGDIMIFTDHINLTGHNPLVGPNQDSWGIRFPDMTRVYDPNLIRIAVSAAQKNNVPVHQGVYAGLLGPSLETPAEIRFLQTIGCDSVGLSTVMEVIAAVHAKMRILGLSLITNINDPDHPAETTVEAVIETARKSVPRLNRLLLDIIRSLDG